MPKTRLPPPLNKHEGDNDHLNFSLAPNNQHLPYALRPVTLAFRYEEESKGYSEIHDLRQGSSLRECNDGFQIPLLPCDASFPAAASTSARWASMALSLPRIEDNTACPVLLINKPKASSFEQVFIYSWRHKLHISVDTSSLNLLVRDRSGDCWFWPSALSALDGSHSGTAAVCRLRCLLTWFVRKLRFPRNSSRSVRKRMHLSKPR